MIEEKQVEVIPTDTFMERYGIEMFRFRKDEKKRVPEGLQKRIPQLLTLVKPKKEV